MCWISKFRIIIHRRGGRDACPPSHCCLLHHATCFGTTCFRMRSHGGAITHYLPPTLQNMFWSTVYWTDMWCTRSNTAENSCVCKLEFRSNSVVRCPIWGGRLKRHLSGYWMAGAITQKGSWSLFQNSPQQEVRHWASFNHTVQVLCFMSLVQHR